MGSGLTELFFREDRIGPAAELFDASSWPHAIEPIVRVLKVSAPTIVLGSSQSFDVVDLDACTSAGVDVVRRRSGGGAVWLDDDMLWVDVFVPTGHARWDADIGRSTWWLGHAWADAVVSAGVAETVVHQGPMVRTEWSSLVCFAGLGAGEVTVGAAKVVGISQRRTRSGALFQCGVVRRWDPARLVGLLRLSHAGREAVMGATATAGHGLGRKADAALDAFVANLPTNCGM